MSDSFIDRFKSSNSATDITKKGSSGNFSNRHKGNTTADRVVNNSSPETQAKRADASLLFLVKGVDDNRAAWYYILIERLKLPMFKRALNNNLIHLEEYGKILYSAYGENPPEEIKKKIKEEFGILED